MQRDLEGTGGVALHRFLPICNLLLLFSVRVYHLLWFIADVRANLLTSFSLHYGRHCCKPRARVEMHLCRTHISAHQDANLPAASRVRVVIMPPSTSFLFLTFCFGFCTYISGVQLESLLVIVMSHRFGLVGTEQAVLCTLSRRLLAVRYRLVMLTWAVDILMTSY